MSHLPFQDLENLYDELAQAIDQVGPEQASVFLAKLVLSLDYTVARRNAEGKKERVPVNIFRTGRLVDPQDLDQPGYVWLRGR